MVVIPTTPWLKYFQYTKCFSYLKKNPSIPGIGCEDNSPVAIFSKASNKPEM